MAFNFNLAISLPGTVSGPLAMLAVAGIRRQLGEDAGGLTDKEAGELFTRRQIVAAALKEWKAVNIAADTAAARADLDTNRADAVANEAAIKAIEAAALAQFESDWA